MKLLSSPTLRGALAGAVVVVLGATGVALAHGTASTTVHGCYATKGGALRVVKAGASCKSGEKAIAWNKTGPRGPRGKTGPAGSARAYAHVNSNATLDTSSSKGIDHVSDFGTGSYCVFLDPSIDVTTIAPVVSLVGFSGSQDTAIYVGANGCSEDTTSGVLVTTTNLAGTAKAAAFYLMVP